jgi:LytTr DNA-binding domain
MSPLVSTEPTPPAAAASTGPAWFWRWRRRIEVGFWVAMTLVNTIANSVIVSMDIRRDGLDFADWKPVVWESSSGVMILLLIPMIAWLTRRFPLHWGAWQRHLPLLLLGSVVFSLLHVFGMVALRELVYASQGQNYDFGHWPSELVYEYLKDVRGYVMIVSIMESYRFIIRRLQGEASLLGPPDEGEPVERVDRPDRFLIRKLGREFLIAANDIEWLQANGNYVNLRVHGHDYPLRSTIAGIETRLEPTHFARIHRSYIVNLSRIASIEPLDSGDARLHLHDGSTLPCSRTYREVLRAKIGAV